MTLTLALSMHGMQAIWHATNDPLLQYLLVRLQQQKQCRYRMTRWRRRHNTCYSLLDVLGVWMRERERGRDGRHGSCTSSTVYLTSCCIGSYLILLYVRSFRKKKALLAFGPTLALPRAFRKEAGVASTYSTYLHLARATDVLVTQRRDRRPYLSLSLSLLSYLSFDILMKRWGWRTR